MAAAEAQIASISAASGGGKGISFLPPQLQQLIELVVARRAAAWALQVRRLYVSGGFSSVLHLASTSLTRRRPTPLSLPRPPGSLPAPSSYRSSAPLLPPPRAASLPSSVSLLRPLPRRQPPRFAPAPPRSTLMPCLKSTAPRTPRSPTSCAAKASVRSTSSAGRRSGSTAATTRTAKPPRPSRRSAAASCAWRTTAACAGTSRRCGPSSTLRCQRIASRLPTPRWVGKRSAFCRC